MSVITKFNEWLTSQQAGSERPRRRWVRYLGNGVTSVKVALAATVVVDLAASVEIIDGAASFAGKVIGYGPIAGTVERIGTEDATVVVLMLVLLQDGGERMGIATKALKIVMKPLLDERYRTGRRMGRQEGVQLGRQEGVAEGVQLGRQEGVQLGASQNQQQWEEWLERERESGRSFSDDNPPPSP